MELRYLGFDQLENARAYRYNLVNKGDAARQFIVTVDLSLFRTHRVSIQEGPTLGAQKLAADLENCAEGVHELTVDDLRAYADSCAAEEERRVAARKSGSRRPNAALAGTRSPWHNRAR